MVEHNPSIFTEKSNHSESDLEKNSEIKLRKNVFVSKIKNFGFFKWNLVLSISLIILLLTGIFSPNSNSRYSDFIQDENLPENAFIQADGKKISVVMYRSPSCECCHLYLDYLEENGFETLEKSFEDYADIKENLMIPANLRTCHTIIMENYYIEGHIPLSVVLVLLQEMPDVDGLALPGMSSGSPGMSGQKNTDWVIFSTSDGYDVKTYQTL